MLSMIVALEVGHFISSMLASATLVTSVHHSLTLHAFFVSPMLATGMATHLFVHALKETCMHEGYQQHMVSGKRASVLLRPDIDSWLERMMHIENIILLLQSQRATMKCRKKSAT